MGFHNFKGLCAKRTNILAYLSPIINDSRVLTAIRDRAVYTAIALPYKISFTESEVDPSTGIFWFELFIDLFFIVDIFMNFRTAVEISARLPLLEPESGSEPSNPLLSAINTLKC